MKKWLWLITACLLIVGIFLAGCGPSKGQVASQIAIAATTTFKDSPTVTHTPSFTTTPTITQTSIPTPSPPTPESIADVKDLSKWVDDYVHAYSDKVTVNGVDMDANRLTDEIRKNSQTLIQAKQVNSVEFAFLVVNGVPLAVLNNGKWENRGIISELFLSKGILFGFPYDMENNPYRKIVRPPNDIVGNYSKISFPEDSFYQDFTFSPKSIKPNWDNIDEYLEFVKKYNLDAGAPFIYWISLTNGYTTDNPKLLQERTKLIVEHCKDTIHAWTVNEIFDDNGKPKSTNTLENVRLVIKTIRDNDPDAKIVINDSGLEWTPKKDKAYFNFIEQLFDEGLLHKGDIVGNQGHNGIGYNKSPQDITNWFNKYAEIGINLRFTETDVFDVTKMSVSNEKKKAEIFLTYYRAGIILNNKFERTVLDAFIVYGSTNSSSWLRDLGRNEYPVLLDDEGRPLLSYYLIIKALFEE